MNSSSELELRHGLYHLQKINCPTKIKGFTDDVLRLDKAKVGFSLSILNQAFQQILTRQYSQLNFEELYRNGYNLVIHKYGNLLYSNLQNVISQHIVEKDQSKVLSSLNKSFLHVMNQTWNNHQSSMIIIRDTLMYLDRVYTSQVGLDDVYSLGLVKFRDLIVYHEPIKCHLKDTLLRLVTLERGGELIDRSSFKFITKMLMVLSNDSANVYKEVFEEPFLQESARCFRAESWRILNNMNVPLYLRRVQQILAEETERSEQCFDQTTTPQLISVAENELIKVHMKDIVEMNNCGVIYMMENKMTEDLAFMYKLLSRAPGGLSTMFGYTSKYLQEQGMIMNQYESTSNNSMSYIQNLLTLKEKFDFYLVHSFENDKNYKKIITSDFECIMNQNPRSSEYLSLFIDEKLRKNFKGMSEEDKIVLLEKTADLFRFLQDKDSFQLYYKQHLAKRLLTGKGLNEESEKQVIAKFREECGSLYTRKMEGMFRDMNSSCTITEQFCKYISEVDDPVQEVDLSLRVLTAVYWPTQNIPPPCNLPISPLKAFQTFEKFYLERHCGRQLTLLPHMGSAEVNVQSFEEGDCLPSAQTHPCGESRSYILQVSTYQMCILTMFNDRLHWTFHDILSETNIQTKDLDRALQSLIMGKPSQKVLIKYPDSRNISPSDTFYVNTSFSSKSNKVKISPYQVKCDTDSERQNTIKSATSGRHMEVEAAIIRVMKENRAIHHEELVKAVVETVKRRFTPSKDFVKMRIETLIEREYIARNPGDRRVYEYIPW